MSKRILHVVTNVGHYDDPNEKTGLWLSELVHAWNEFEAAGYEQQLVSPKGGHVPLEPRALHFPIIDRETKAWLDSPERMRLLETTLRPDEVDAGDFDAIYFTGGHAVMYDFPDDAGLQRITRELWQRGAVVSSVCHGYCGLLNVTLDDGTRLVAGRQVTGFAWIEEVLAGVAKRVPYNAERSMRQRGAHYRRTPIPFTSHTEVDGRLITGQNPASAKATAKRVIEALEA